MSILGFFGIKSAEEKRAELDTNIKEIQAEIQHLEAENNESRRTIARLELIIRQTKIKADATKYSGQKIDLEYAVQNNEVQITRLKVALEGLYTQKRRMAA